MIRFNQRERKNLLQKISKLTVVEKQEIFKILQSNNISFTKNSNGLFFNLSDVNDHIISEINNIADMFINNKAELQAKERELHQNINKYSYVPGSSSSQFNKKLSKNNDNWQLVINEKKSNEKVSSFLNHLEENVEKNMNQKKKGSMKYYNAKKKFSRKLNEKKFEVDVCNNLSYDEY